MKIIGYLIWVLLIFSCKRDNCQGINTKDEINYHVIPQKTIDRIPFSGTDSQIFVSNLFDTIIFQGTGSSKYFITFSSVTGLDCQKRVIENYENLERNYTSLNQKATTLEHKIYLDNDYVYHGGPTGLNIYVGGLFAGSSFEPAMDLAGNEDSIYLNGQFVSGLYLNANKSILFNHNYGVIKFKQLNETWQRIK